MNNWLKIPIEVDMKKDINGYFTTKKKQALFDQGIVIKNKIAQGVTRQEYQQLEAELQAISAALEVLDNVWDKLHLAH